MVANQLRSRLLASWAALSDFNAVSCWPFMKRDSARFK